ncbi:hypothetical protein [Rubellicoccus peritrichatus]|uniref:PEP-CTERM protein-sorting domain-containing protein n=1 Tax=Rubellicoccus peritrichatus TaxID=3080537 RepID=A0AAQ3LA29_9BACT|nr:hypothetical protein [Puniceicoccus sp. CR14]WOO42080.1 hypothetical protein RZN69_03200 [Puniceicoccus sp. CR14]
MKSSNATSATKTVLGTGAASITALIGTSSLDGAIVTNTDLGLPGFTVGNGSGSAAWNIDNSGAAEVNVASISVTAIGLYLVYFQGLTNGFSERVATAYTNRALNLGANAEVNSGDFNAVSALLMSSGSLGASVSGFNSGESGYLGFQFNPSGSLVLYGWAEVILTDGGNSGTVEIVQWAYEDTGANIQTPIPEPATVATGLGALALGAAGLRRWRKSRQVA